MRRCKYCKIIYVIHEQETCDLCIEEINDHKIPLDLLNLIDCEFLFQKKDNHVLDFCSICLNEIQNVEFRRRLYCFHVFHDACIKSWMNFSNVCPNCRIEVEKNTNLY